jgi:hypothetical protein
MRNNQIKEHTGIKWKSHAVRVTVAVSKGKNPQAIKRENRSPSYSEDFPTPLI